MLIDDNYYMDCLNLNWFYSYRKENDLSTN